MDGFVFWYAAIRDSFKPFTRKLVNPPFQISTVQIHAVFASLPVKTFWSFPQGAKTDGLSL